MTHEFGAENVLPSKEDEPIDSSGQATHPDRVDSPNSTSRHPRDTLGATGATALAGWEQDTAQAALLPADHPLSGEPPTAGFSGWLVSRRSF